jgi:DNA-binding response OmpR family regulator
VSDEGGRVLVVEHQPAVAELQRLYLTREGFEVSVELDVARAPVTVATVRPDLVVLDLSAPGAPGDLYLRVASAAGRVPIVAVVTAVVTPEGAPQARTVVRPFSPRVLVAAVVRALREDLAGSGQVLRAGLLELDPAARTVTSAGRQVPLTATEFDLLAFLLAHPGRVFARDQLMKAAWGASLGTGARTVDVHIAQIRAKLGDSSPIRTVRGVGYAAD